MLYSAVVPYIRTACSGLLDYLYTTAPTTATALRIPETDSRYDLCTLFFLEYLWFFVYICYLRKLFIQGSGSHSPSLHPLPSHSSSPSSPSFPLHLTELEPTWHEEWWMEREVLLTLTSSQ